MPVFQVVIVTAATTALAQHGSVVMPRKGVVVIADKLLQFNVITKLKFLLFRTVIVRPMMERANLHMLGLARTTAK